MTEEQYFHKVSKVINPFGFLKALCAVTSDNTWGFKNARKYSNLHMLLSSPSTKNPKSQIS